MQKVYLVSFGDTRLGISICRFKQEAESMEVFDDIFIYTEASLPLEFKEYFRDKFYAKRDGTSVIHYNTGWSLTHNGLAPTRGFGYWCWKPKVILMALEQIKEGDLLIYCDIGHEFCSSKREELLEMLQEVDKNEVMGLLHKIIEKEYQKGDTLDYFGLSDDEEFLNSPQFTSGFICLKKNKKTMELISQWMEIFYKHYSFVTDEPSRLPNKEGFKQNLHDQSIFSILMKKNKYKSFPMAFYYERQWNAHCILYNRNKIYLPSNVDETRYLNNEILQGGKRGVHNTHHAKTFVAEYKKLKAQSSQQKLPKYLAELDNAKSRIHSHLAYKLGSAMILNSKSLWGYIRMPYVLSFIKESHREEQRKYQIRVAKNPKLKLPKLESYPDYKEAIKEKECFTYKLGEALIKANNVRGGGANICLFAILQRSA